MGVKVWAGWFLVRALPCLAMATLNCVLRWPFFGVCRRWGGSGSPLKRALILSSQGPTLMTSFNPTSLEVLPPNTVTLGIMAST